MWALVLKDIFRPAGGQFQVEIASNRAQTTLSYDGQYASDWPDGKNYPDDYVRYFKFHLSVEFMAKNNAEQNVPSCITSPNSLSSLSFVVFVKPDLRVFSAHAKSVYGGGYRVRYQLSGEFLVSVPTLN